MNKKQKSKIDELIVKQLSEDPRDIHKMYEMLSSVNKEVSLDCIMKIPLSLGGDLCFYDHEGFLCSSLLYEDGTQDDIIAPQDKLESENILMGQWKAYQRSLDKSQGIIPLMGVAAPANFKKSILNMQSGDIATYNTGHSYLALRDKKAISLYEIKKNPESIYAARSKEPVIISLTDLPKQKIELQKFFLEIVDNDTKNVIVRETKRKNIERELFTGIKKEKSSVVTFDMCHQSFIAKKTAFGIRFYDQNGNKINKETIIYCMAIAKTAPVNIKAYSKESPDISASMKKELEENMFYSEYAKVLNGLKDIVLRCNTPILIDTIMQEKFNYYSDAEIAVLPNEKSIIFYQITRDEAGEILSLAEVDSNYLFDLWKQKFLEQGELFKSELISGIQIPRDTFEKDPSKKEQFIKSIRQEIELKRSEYPLLRPENIKRIDEESMAMIEAYKSMQGPRDEIMKILEYNLGLEYDDNER